MDAEIELRHIRYFVAVAEELHFGRAAVRLHLAQPPLSQQIRKLEEILGYPLFNRTSRAVKLTAAGQVFLERARRILTNLQDDLSEVRSVARGEVGFLKVGFIGSGMLTRIPSLLGRYRRAQPKVQLQLSESHSSDVIARLIKGSLDAGILRDGDPTDELCIEPLFEEPFIAVVPRQHVRAGQRSIVAGDLRDDPFVFFSPLAGRRAYETTMSLCDDYGFRPAIVQEAPQWLTVLRLVGAGLGVTIAPACVRQIAGPDTACLPLRKTRAKSCIELAYRVDDDRAVLKAFVQLAHEQFGHQSGETRQASI